MENNPHQPKKYKNNYKSKQRKRKSNKARQLALSIPNLLASLSCILFLTPINKQANAFSQEYISIRQGVQPCEVFDLGASSFESVSPIVLEAYESTQSVYLTTSREKWPIPLLSYTCNLAYIQIRPLQLHPPFLECNFHETSESQIFSTQSKIFCSLNLQIYPAKAGDYKFLYTHFFYGPVLDSVVNAQDSTETRHGEIKVQVKQCIDFWQDVLMPIAVKSTTHTENIIEWTPFEGIYYPTTLPPADFDIGERYQALNWCADYIKIRYTSSKPFFTLSDPEDLTNSGAPPSNFVQLFTKVDYLAGLDPNPTEISVWIDMDANLLAQNTERNLNLPTSLQSLSLQYSLVILKSSRCENNSLQFRSYPGIQNSVIWPQLTEVTQSFVFLFSVDKYWCYASEFQYVWYVEDQNQNLVKKMDNGIFIPQNEQTDDNYAQIAKKLNENLELLPFSIDHQLQSWEDPSWNLYNPQTLNYELEYLFKMKAVDWNQFVNFPQIGEKWILKGKPVFRDGSLSGGSLANEVEIFSIKLSAASPNAGCVQTSDPTDLITRFRINPHWFRLFPRQKIYAIDVIEGVERNIPFDIAFFSGCQPEKYTIDIFVPSGSDTQTILQSVDPLDAPVVQFNADTKQLKIKIPSLVIQSGQFLRFSFKVTSYTIFGQTINVGTEYPYNYDFTSNTVQANYAELEIRPYSLAKFYEYSQFSQKTATLYGPFPSDFLSSNLITAGNGVPTPIPYDMRDKLTSLSFQEMIQNPQSADHEFTFELKQSYASLYMTTEPLYSTWPYIPDSNLLGKFDPQPRGGETSDDVPVYFQYSESAAEAFPGFDATCNPNWQGDPTVNRIDLEVYIPSNYSPVLLQVYPTLEMLKCWPLRFPITCDETLQFAIDWKVNSSNEKYAEIRISNANSLKIDDYNFHTFTGEKKVDFEECNFGILSEQPTNEWSYSVHQPFCLKERNVEYSKVGTQVGFEGDPPQTTIWSYSPLQTKSEQKFRLNHAYQLSENDRAQVVTHVQETNVPIVFFDRKKLTDLVSENTSACYGLQIVARYQGLNTWRDDLLIFASTESDPNSLVCVDATQGIQKVEKTLDELVWLQEQTAGEVRSPLVTTVLISQLFKVEIQIKTYILDRYAYDTVHWFYLHMDHLNRIGCQTILQRPDTSISQFIQYFEVIDKPEAPYEENPDFHQIRDVKYNVHWVPNMSHARRFIKPLMFDLFDRQSSFTYGVPVDDIALDPSVKFFCGPRKVSSSVLNESNLFAPLLIDRQNYLSDLNQYFMPNMQLPASYEIIPSVQPQTIHSVEDPIIKLFIDATMAPSIGYVRDNSKCDFGGFSADHPYQLQSSFQYKLYPKTASDGYVEQEHKLYLNICHCALTQLKTQIDLPSPNYLTYDQEHSHPSIDVTIANQATNAEVYIDYNKMTDIEILGPTFNFENPCLRRDNQITFTEGQTTNVILFAVGPQPDIEFDPLANQSFFSYFTPVTQIQQTDLLVQKGQTSQGEGRLLQGPESIILRRDPTVSVGTTGQINNRPFQLNVFYSFEKLDDANPQTAGNSINYQPLPESDTIAFRFNVRLLCEITQVTVNLFDINDTKITQSETLEVQLSQSKIFFELLMTDVNGNPCNHDFQVYLQNDMDASSRQEINYATIDSQTYIFKRDLDGQDNLRLRVEARQFGVGNNNLIANVSGKMVIFVPLCVVHLVEVVLFDAQNTVVPDGQTLQISSASETINFQVLSNNYGDYPPCAHPFTVQLYDSVDGTILDEIAFSTDQDGVSSISTAQVQQLQIARQGAPLQIYVTMQRQGNQSSQTVSDNSPSIVVLDQACLVQIDQWISMRELIENTPNKVSINPLAYHIYNEINYEYSCLQCGKITSGSTGTKLLPKLVKTLDQTTIPFSWKYKISCEEQPSITPELLDLVPCYGLYEHFIFQEPFVQPLENQKCKDCAELSKSKQQIEECEMCTILMQEANEPFCQQCFLEGVPYETSSACTSCRAILNLTKNGACSRCDSHMTTGYLRACEQCSNSIHQQQLPTCKQCDEIIPNCASCEIQRGDQLVCVLCLPGFLPNEIYDGTRLRSVCMPPNKASVCGGSIQKLVEIEQDPLNLQNFDQNKCSLRYTKTMPNCQSLVMNPRDYNNRFDEKFPELFFGWTEREFDQQLGTFECNHPLDSELWSDIKYLCELRDKTMLQCDQCEPGFHKFQHEQVITTEYETYHPIFEGQPFNLYSYDVQTVCKKNDDVGQTYSFFVKSLDEFALTDLEKEKMFDQYENLGGRTLRDPLFFLQQVFANFEDRTYNPTSFSAANNVTVDIWLFKGVHHFIQCDTMSDEVRNYYLSIKEKFNIELPLLCFDEQTYWPLRKVNQVQDNVKFFVRPIECKDSYSSLAGQFGDCMADYACEEYFRKNCVDFEKGDRKPQIRIHSKHTAFNVTNFAQFENIEFTGEDMLMNLNRQNISSELDLMLQEVYYQQKCNLTYFKPENALSPIKDYIKNPEIVNLAGDYNCSYARFDYERDLPTNITTAQCSNMDQFSNEAAYMCPGEVDHPDFFRKKIQQATRASPILDLTTTEILYAYRHQALFNLYAFDSVRSNKVHAPTLNLINCDFKFFLGQSALIQVENNNFIDTEGQGRILVGEDRGANIHLEGSKFENSNFCKGLIVYQKLENLQNSVDRDPLPVYLNLTAQVQRRTLAEIERVTPKIVVEKCHFENLNYLQRTKTLALLQDKYDQTSVSKTHGLRKRHHRGLILNLQRFQGQIQIQNSTVRKNLVYIAETAVKQPFDPSSRFIRPQQMAANDDFVNTHELHFFACPKFQQKPTYLFDKLRFVQDDKESVDLNTIQNLVESVSPLFIEGQTSPLILLNNTFEENAGTIGGVLNFNAPDFLTDTPYVGLNQVKPFVLIEGNIFKQNMGYFGANAVSITHTVKRVDSFSDFETICGVGTYIARNQFVENIGARFCVCGALVTRCQTINSYNSTYVQRNLLSGLQYDVDNLWEIESKKQNQSIFSVLQTIPDALTGQDLITMPKYATVITQNVFERNFGGWRGAALLCEYIDLLQISENTFKSNQVTTSIDELAFSPYSKHFYNSKVPISLGFDHENCRNEISFVENCAEIGNRQIEMPKQLGAVFIKGCTSKISCFLPITEDYYRNEYKEILTVKMEEFFQKGKLYRQLPLSQVLVNGNHFEDNRVFPQLYLNNRQEEKGFGESQVESLKVIGVIDLTVDNNLFQGSPDQNRQAQFYQMAPKIAAFFPEQFLTRHMAPLIETKTPNLQSQVDWERKAVHRFTRNIFKDHIHIQNVVQKDPTNLDSNASLLHTTGSSHSPSELIFESNALLNNSFIGVYTSMVQVKDFVEVSIHNNTISNLGNQLDSTKVYQRKGFGSFRDYKLTERQHMGAFRIQRSSSSPMIGVWVTQNLFEDLRCIQGCVLSGIGDLGQQIVLKDNHYRNIRISDESLIDRATVIEIYDFSLPESRGFAKLVLIREIFQNVQPRALKVHNGKSLAKSLIIMKQGQFSDCMNALDVDMRGVISVSESTFSYTPKRKTFLSKSNSQIIIRGVSFMDFNAQQTILIDKRLQISTNLTELLELDSLSDEKIAEIERIQAKSLFRGTNFRDISGSKGSLFSFENSQIAFIQSVTKNLIFENISSSDGAPIEINENSMVSFEGIVARNCSGKEGGFLGVKQARLVVKSSEFINNRAKEGGVIFAQQNAFIKVQKSEFVNNYATEGSILFAKSVRKTEQYDPIRFIDSRFLQNSAESGLMTLQSSTIGIENSIVQNSVAFKGSPGFVMQNSILNLMSSEFTQDTHNEQSFSQLAFVEAKKSQISIINSTFSNMIGTDTSVIHISEKSDLKIEYGKFVSNNFQSQEGSAIFVEQESSISLNGVNMEENQGYGIVVKSSPSMIQVTDSVFSKNKNTAISAFKSSLLISNSTFQEAEVREVAAVMCDQCDEVEIQNSQFSKNRAENVAGTFLRDSKRRAIFLNNTFVDNEAANESGALKIERYANLTFENNLFLRNKAGRVAGGLYLACCEKDTYSMTQGMCANQNDLSLLCQVNFTQSNRFVENEAQRRGGAIALQNIRQLDLNTTFFRDNTALYGQNLAGYNTEIVLGTPKDSIDGIYDSEKKELVFAPGQPFSISLNFLDQIGAKFEAEDQAIAIMKIVETDQDQGENGRELQSGLFPKIIRLEGHEQRSNDGMIDFQALKILMEPGTTAIAEFILAHTDFTDTELAQMRPLHKFQLIARQCHEWEEQRDLECFAGSQKYPKIGFWRANFQSSEWVRCPRAELCLGGDVQNLLGICDLGYTGPLCGSCSVGYYSSAPFECQKCMEIHWEIAMQLFIWLTFCLMVIIIAWLTSKQVYSKVPVLLVYVRLLFDFAKELRLVVLLAFMWPKNHQNLLLVFKWPIIVVESLAIRPCLWRSETSTVNPLLAEIVQYALIPLLIFLVIFVWQHLIGTTLIQRSAETRQILIKQATFLSIALLSPALAVKFTSLIRCIPVESGKFRAIDDTSVECWTRQSGLFLLLVCLPGTILWLLVPSFVYIRHWQRKERNCVELKHLLMIDKAKQTESEFMTSFGFLACGYQNEPQKKQKRKADRRKANQWHVGDQIKRQSLADKIKQKAQTFYVIKLIEDLWLVIVISLLQQMGSRIQHLTFFLIFGTRIGLYSHFANPYSKKKFDLFEFWGRLTCLALLISTLLITLDNLENASVNWQPKYFKERQALDWILWVINFAILTTYTVFLLSMIRYEILYVFIGEPDSRIVNILTCDNPIKDRKAFKERLYLMDMGHKPDKENRRKMRDPRKLIENYNTSEDNVKARRQRQGSKVRPDFSNSHHENSNSRINQSSQNLVDYSKVSASHVQFKQKSSDQILVVDNTESVGQGTNRKGVLKKQKRGNNKAKSVKFTVDKPTYGQGATLEPRGGDELIDDVDPYESSSSKSSETSSQTEDDQIKISGTSSEISSEQPHVLASLTRANYPKPQKSGGQQLQQRIKVADLASITSKSPSDQTETESIHMNNIERQLKKALNDNVESKF